MNIHHYDTLRNLILAAVLTTGFASSALALELRAVFVDLNSKKATALGTLGGDNNSSAQAINDAGQVVASSYTANGPPEFFHAFITGPNGAGMTDLGTLGGGASYAYGVNGAGQVVGFSYTANTSDPNGPGAHGGRSPNGPNHAFITGPNGADMTDLGTLGGYLSSAHGINDAGQVVGESTTANAPYGPGHAFITGPNGVGMTDLGTLGGDYSYAYGINDAGQVVGDSSSASDAQHAFAQHAFITGPNGVGMTDLGTLGGSNSLAYGINDAGQVVGQSTTANDPSGPFHAFITGPDGVGMTDLGTFGGDNNSVAYGINDAGQVVGQSTNDNGQTHAFITGPHGVGMTDIASLVNPPTGFTYFTATAINNHGQLAAVGAVVPEPEVYAILLLGLGLVGFLARGRAAT